jgi:Uma2 family endonuclease
MSSTSSQLKNDLAEVVSRLITEDDEPVDNIFSAKQQRLLVEPLYSSWTPPPREEEESETPATGPRPFLADANVGIFFSVHQPPLVPDMFLSLDVEPGAGWKADECRSYFVWEFGKVPDVVVEVVSNREGQELGSKRRRYAEWGIGYYVVFDPFRELSDTVLCVYELGFGKRYRPREGWSLPGLGLSLTLWEGAYEGIRDTWLRWCDAEGRQIPTGKEGRDQAVTLAQREADRAARAEAEVARLRDELARLSNSPTS